MISHADDATSCADHVTLCAGRVTSRACQVLGQMGAIPVGPEVVTLTQAFLFLSGGCIVMLELCTYVIFERVNIPHVSDKY